MGNTPGRPDEDHENIQKIKQLSLDQVGGVNRPAIKRGDSLAMKLRWLQDGLDDTATDMTKKLDLQTLKEDVPGNKSGESSKYPNKPAPKLRSAGSGVSVSQKRTSFQKKQVSSRQDSKKSWVSTNYQGQGRDLDAARKQASMDRARASRNRAQSFPKSKTIEEEPKQEHFKREQLHSDIREISYEPEKKYSNTPYGRQSKEQDQNSIPEWRKNVERAQWKAKVAAGAVAFYMKHKQGDYARPLAQNDFPVRVSMLLAQEEEAFSKQQVKYTHLQKTLQLNKETEDFNNTGQSVNTQVKQSKERKYLRLQSVQQSLSTKQREITNEVREVMNKLIPENPESGIESAEIEIQLARKLAKQYRMDALGIDDDSPETDTPESDQALQLLANDAHLMMQMYVNRVNSKWLKNVNFRQPYVVDPRVARFERVDVSLYKQMAINLFVEGKVAFMLIDCGEDFVAAPEDGGEVQLLPLATTDPWQALKIACPSKIPTGERLEGLSFTGRQMLQLAADLYSYGGQAAIDKASVVLCVTQDQSGTLLDKLKYHKYYGFKRENVFIIDLEYFKGMAYKEAGEDIEVAKSSEMVPAGSGHAMLQLANREKAFQFDEHGDKQVIPGSLLSVLLERDQQWIQVSMLSDVNHCTQGQSIDPQLVGSGIFFQEENASNMVMEVIRAEDDSVIRQHDSLVIENPVHKDNSINIRFGDLQTPDSYQKLVKLFDSNANQSSDSSVYVSTHRYVFHLESLKELLAGPEIFNPDIQIAGEHVYLTHDISDLTFMEGAKCIAVQSQSDLPGPLLSRRFIGDKDLYDCVDILIKQDRKIPFRTTALGLSAKQAPVRLKMKAFMENRIRVVVFLQDNQASRCAFRLARYFLKNDTDSLKLITIVHDSQNMSQAKDFLEKLQDEKVADQVERMVLPKEGNSTVDHMKDIIEREQPDLVIVGSERLSGGAFGDLGSLSLNLVRNIINVPILVVKSNSVGQVFQQPDVLGVRPSLEVMVDVTPSCRSMIEWLCEHLNEKKEDKFILARPKGLEGLSTETIQTKRMLDLYSDVVSSHGYQITRSPMQGSDVAEYPKLVESKKVDIIALSAPAAKITPEDIEQLLHSVKSSILIFRGTDPF